MASDTDIKKALAEAVSALYFNDNSDYETALWKVVEFLGGSAAIDLLNSDSSAAYQTYAANI